MASLRSLSLTVLALSASLNVGGVQGVSHHNSDVPVDEDDPLRGYVSINPEVEDLANIALDVQAMHSAHSRHAT